MVSIHVLIGFCCLALAAAAPAEQPRIIGGEAAYMGEFPYKVSLRRDTRAGLRHFCGGSLITTKHVLTAAHCVVNYLEGGIYAKDIDSLSIYLGSVSYLVAGQAYEIETIRMHNDYNDDTLVNDIAVIKLKTEVKLYAAAQTIALSTETEFKDKTTVVVSGFGAYNEASATGHHTTAFLRKAELLTMSREECQSIWKSVATINKSQLCTSTANKTGTCVGDSGGPLVLDGKQIGIVSFGSTTCAGGIPNVFTNVGHYTDFIEDCINNM